MSRQAYRLARQLPTVRAGAHDWLGSARSAQAVELLARRQAEFGHLVVLGYRQGHYTPAAALVRSLFEEATLLASMAMPDDSEEQAPRAVQVLLAYYKDVTNKG